jgi:hypothetical protein
MRKCVVVARPMPDLVTDRLSAEFDAVLAEGSDIGPDVLVRRAEEH